MSAKLWHTYYSINAIADRDIPWGLGPDLTAEEARDVVPSLQEFQLGESSDGARLRSAARVWASRNGDELLPAVIDLFVAEERRHAGELARFLMLNGHGLRTRSPGDAAFRILRGLTGGLELSLTVLMTAEIIGFGYYASLRRMTRSRLLAAICETFLRDESAHLLFHAEMLALLRRERSPAARRVVRWLTRGFLAGACAVVWMGHRRILGRGGRSFGSFLGWCLSRWPAEPARLSMEPGGSQRAKSRWRESASRLCPFIARLQEREAFVRTPSARRRGSPP